ncbi:peptidase inhibitor family I36 protein [Streptomyces sp. JJ36]|uniref:peptidase inhibitor family I36 protein n=1 Tax=Streptomyces sp. JJ36 TaxID=2736645 RepID=UPI001F44F6A0|nr:peptidase inhibitor family I36 protein [Streptomyces sp. JJ36]MCF6525070.1 peptidase inhibitor family I36 protein [Streptomyces sp. JJ36]
MKKAIALLAPLALAASGVAATASPAAASACPEGATCAYTSPNWAGSPGPVWQNNTNLSGYAKWRGAESIYNNGTYCNVYIYSGTNYTGTRYPLNLNTGWKSIAGSQIWHHAYSNKWYGSRC